MQSFARRLLVLASLVVAGTTVAACAAEPTAPRPSAPAEEFTAPASRIEGDTLQCRSGWNVVNGRYVCNEG